MKCLMAFFVAGCVAWVAFAVSGTYDDLAGQRADDAFWRPSVRALVVVDRSTRDIVALDASAQHAAASPASMSFDSRDGTIRNSCEETISTGKPRGTILCFR